MALLKFHAREDHLVREPLEHLVKGAVASYVGRRYVAASNSFEAGSEPFAVDSESKEGQRVALLCVRDESLWAADRATAEALGVPFVPIKLVDGAWVAAPESPRAVKPAKE
jgi:hypothetical protein